MKYNAEQVAFMLAEAIDENREYKSWHVSTQHLMTLVERVVAAEREACAKILDANALACESHIMRSLLQANAQAIRERGQEPAVYSSFGLMGGDAFVSGDSLKRNLT